MRLHTPEQVHLSEMMTWFNDQNELKIWAGPNFRYPYNLESFTKDLNLDDLDSFVYVASDKSLMGFGQSYQRLECCHLGRLVISPEHRGLNLIASLIDLLSERGTKQYNTSMCSLFVFKDNQPAIRAYKKLGFKESSYPEENPMKNCLYMQKVYPQL